jgi:ABC-type bacteriocin/lantibiotic exporter with double-glycine peptidase domain
MTSIDDISDYLEFINRTKVINSIFDGIDYDKVDSTDIVYNNHNLEFDTIIFKNITFKYKYSKKIILDNFSLKIEANNKIIGITGKSGIGKSTFIKLLLKLYKYNGNIYIDGVDIQKLSTEYIRKSIVYVNQESKLFDKKIIDNLFYACSNKDKCTVYLEEIMKFEKIKDLFKNIDLNKKSVKAGDNLSGGQKQVINIINGLISPSKILILDEPTNALDQSLKNEIINLIVYFKKYKKCIIIISHDKDMYPYFDQKVSINSLNEEEEEEEIRRKIHEYE